jgi:hypothetical protein
MYLLEEKSERKTKTAIIIDAVRDSRIMLHPKKDTQENETIKNRIFRKNVLFLII